ncbi:MAG TPA: GNAT family N-acetyltransferase [Gemmatimonadaceae bacterium]|nr:GNAT family N-acetyltransferase [Gemmatimonadaceae bacterium]
MSEFYQLRRMAIKDLSAYCGFLVGFLGSAPFAWRLLASQLEAGDFAAGLWYFFGIVSAAGLFGGTAGLVLGFIIGWTWEHFHQRRRARASAMRALNSKETPPRDPALEITIGPPEPVRFSDPPRLRLVTSEPASRELPQLQTLRLVLRPFTYSDAPLVQTHVSDRRVADTTLNIPHPYPPGGAEEWISRHEAAWMAGEGATYAIIRRADATLLGAIALGLSPQNSAAELGYWIAVPYWNQGFCTEAGIALLNFAFTDFGLNRIQARHLVRNPSSGRVMQKLGMQLEGVHRQSVRKWDRYEDVAVYGILSDEWRSLSATRKAHSE